MRELAIKELERNYRSYHHFLGNLAEGEARIQKEVDRWRKMTDSDLLDEVVHDAYERGFAAGENRDGD